MASLKPQTVVIARQEIDTIHAHLKRGKKRRLAAFIGISPPLLSRYINYRNLKYFDGFKMPRDVYEKINQFLHVSV